MVPIIAATCMLALITIPCTDFGGSVFMVVVAGLTVLVDQGWGCCMMALCDMIENGVQLACITTVSIMAVSYSAVSINFLM